jgi:hypothetical protein
MSHIPSVALHLVRRFGRLAVGTALGVLFPVSSKAQQHDHGAMASHAGGPVDCRTLAAPPWSGLPEADRRAIASLQTSLAPFRATSAAARDGFAPTLGDIPTMGVHWVNRTRMEDGVRVEHPDHLLFTRIGGRDSLVGAAYAFRGPVNATIPPTFSSDLAHWHDHANLGGGAGQTLHMLHVWFVPSPYGPFAGNNFFLPLMAAGIATPNPCWITSKTDVDRFELVATLVDLLHRQQDTAMMSPGSRRQARRGLGGGGMAGGAMGGGAAMQGPVAALATRLAPQLAALDSAARRNERAEWEQSADALLGALQPDHRHPEQHRRTSAPRTSAPRTGALTFLLLVAPDGEFARGTARLGRRYLERLSHGQHRHDAFPLGDADGRTRSRILHHRAASDVRAQAMGHRGEAERLHRHHRRRVVFFANLRIVVERHRDHDHARPGAVRIARFTADLLRVRFIRRFLRLAVAQRQSIRRARLGAANVETPRLRQPMIWGEVSIMKESFELLTRNDAVSEAADGTTGGNGNGNVHEMA